jgi:hypothetical protein
MFSLTNISAQKRNMVEYLLSLCRSEDKAANVGSSFLSILKLVL